MKKESMEKIRKGIREKDRQIVGLLNERASLSAEMGRLKDLLGREIYDPAQERRVLRCVAEINEGPLSAEALGRIYREILSSSRQIQAPLSVACLGPESSFTQMAALSHFGGSARILPQKSIGRVFDELEKGRVSFGVVPLENSVEGTVKLTLDRLIDTPGERHSGNDVATRLGLDKGAHGLAGILAWPGRWCRKLGLDFPITTAARDDGGTDYLMEPEIAELFGRARAAAR